ncbi:hypothetical protein Csa_016790 [Cucumis sativus]|uniref:Uncharacterized protein n=1 Tax=Cucumis sativus TaxID=3659 RepID=A0A0A0K3G9_CUCSA|nr:hypothetical protein Csa_016790 [Cucumis sativus]
MLTKPPLSSHGWQRSSFPENAFKLSKLSLLDESGDSTKTVYTTSCGCWKGTEHKIPDSSRQIGAGTIRFCSKRLADLDQEWRYPESGFGHTVKQFQKRKGEELNNATSIKGTTVNSRAEKIVLTITEVGL